MADIDNYDDLTQAQADGLEAEPAKNLAAAGLLVLLGVDNGILTTEEGLKQIGNLFTAIYETN